MASWSLPLSLLGAFSILPIIGVSFNIITMLAFVICIGMLVDNSIVISEYYSRLITENKKPTQSAALESVRQFAKPITATVLTTIAAFLPMLVTTGVMGEFIKWIPIVVTIAFLMSLFESFCLLPNRLQWLPQSRPSRYQIKILTKMLQIENLFERLIKKIVAKKYISLGCISFLILLTALVFKFGSRIDLFSSRSPTHYSALIVPKPNTPLSLLDEKTKQIAEKMQSILGGEKTIQWMSVNMDTQSAQIFLRVKYSALKKLNYKNILNELRKIDKGGLKNIRFKARAGGPPIGKPLNVVIQSNSRKKIRKFIDEVSPEIEKIHGLTNLKSDPEKDIGT